MVNLLFLFLSFQIYPETTDQFGKAHDPESPGTSITVIDFAASWCKPCWKALPHVNALKDQDVKVLVICEDEKRRGRDKLVSKLNLKVPVVWDQGHRWAEKYQPKGMPSTMIVDQDGKVLYSHVGYDQAKWATFLSKLKQFKAQELGKAAD